MVVAKNDPELRELHNLLIGGATRMQPISVSYGARGDSKQQVRLNDNAAALSSMQKQPVFSRLATKTQGSNTHVPSLLYPVRAENNINIPDFVHSGKFNIIPDTGAAEIDADLDELIRYIQRTPKGEKVLLSSNTEGENYEFFYSPHLDGRFPTYLSDRTVRNGILNPSEVYTKELDLLRSDFAQDVEKALRMVCKEIGADILSVQVTVTEEGQIVINNFHLDFRPLIASLTEEDYSRVMNSIVANKLTHGKNSKK